MRRHHSRYRKPWRNKRYYPRHRKREILLLRRAIQAMTEQMVFSYLTRVYVNGRILPYHTGRWIICRAFWSTGAQSCVFTTQDAHRIVLRVHKDTISRYLALRYYW